MSGKTATQVELVFTAFYVQLYRLTPALLYTRFVQKVPKLFKLRSSHLLQMHSLGVARFTGIS